MPDIFVLPRQWTAQPTGAPYAGAKLYFYQAGTFVQQDVFQDFTLTTPHDQPVEADDGGKFPVIFLNGEASTDYRIVLRNRFGTLIDDLDNIPRSSVTTTQIGRAINAQTPAEITSSVTPADYTYGAYPYNLARIGLVPNNTGAAAANTAAIKALLNPSVTGITGKVMFPNTTGSDIYYFNDIIPVRDGIHINLCGCTVNFTKTGVAGDAASGFFHAIRDFSIENGSIVVRYTHTSGSNTGNALAFGGRASGSAYWPNIYDSLLSSPMGNIVVRNISIDSNAGGGEARGIFMLGGLRNVLIENVKIEGNSALIGGIYYEFGWATNEASEENRQTSHAHNLQIKNIIVQNLETSTIGIGVGLTGAYNAVIENLKCYTVKQVINITPGESLFYRPWSNNDGAGSKRNILIRNVVGNSIASIGIGVTGASASTGYLNPLALTAVSKVDLLDVEIDGFSMIGTSDNYGISCSAGRAIIRNGRLVGFQRGIVTTQECTKFLIDGVDIFDSTSIGIQIGLANSFYSPARFSIGAIRNCFIAGSGTAGTSPAISAGTTQSLVIESNRFGYETIHDTLTETTQAQAVSVASDAFGVVCRNNYVAATSGGAVAYSLTSGSSSHRGCTIDNASGVVTTSGIWKSVLQGVSADRGDNSVTLAPLADYVNQRFDTALTGNKTITLSTTGAVNGDRFHITRTGLGAFTLAVGSLKTIPNSTAASVAVEYDGSAWKLRDYTLL